MKQSDLKQIVDALKPVLVTKDDLKGFATKDDLKDFATKDDLNGFATKDDLNGLATKDDLKGFATQDGLKDLEAKIDTLDAKQEFINIKLDGFLGEILDAREAQELQAPKISNHSDELEKHDQRIKALENRQKSSPTPISSSLV